MMKRSLDITIALIGLVFVSPLLFVSACVIFLCNGLPILFRQMRIGLRGRTFILYKFRTMTLFHFSREGSFDAGKKDRITRIGAFLRNAKLDEIPQLWNVLKGDMSLVGPRPEVRKWVDAYPERWAKVLTIRPGMTDSASIYYRNEEELLAYADDPEAYYRDHILPHKLDLYEEYVRSRSFCGDIYLIFKTILSLIFPKCFSCHHDYVSAGKTENPS